MLPVLIVVRVLDAHILVEVHHVGSLVVVGSAEQPSEELHHRGVQLGYVADILEVVEVDFLVIEGVLIELSNDLL